MKTYVITFYTNYGERFAVIRAKSEQDLLSICKNDDYVWDDCIEKIIELTGKESEGIILIGG